jgi:hypothetical protein
MAGGRRVWLLGTMLLLAGGLAACATSGGERPRDPGVGSEVPPAEPLYRRTFTTPAGRQWEFQIGGYGSER